MALALLGSLLQPHRRRVHLVSDIDLLTIDRIRAVLAATVRRMEKDKTVADI